MKIQILLAPYDSGHRGWRCGAGPEHLLQAGLVAHLEARGHSVTAVHLLEDDPTRQPAEIRTAFELARRLAAGVRAARAAGDFPLVLSGNCNSAVGTLSGLSTELCAAFWFDAHGDFNTPDTTTTGFLDGMGLAMAAGMCWQELLETVPGFQPLLLPATFLIGARDLDPAEAALLEKSPVTRVAAAEVPGALPALLAKAPLNNVVGYLHLDLDVLDPSVGRANYLPVPDGLSVNQLTGAIAAIRRRVPLGAAAVSSYSPHDDQDQGICRAAFAAIEAMVG